MIFYQRDVQKCPRTLPLWCFCEPWPVCLRPADTFQSAGGSLPPNRWRWRGAHRDLGSTARRPRSIWLKDKENRVRKFAKKNFSQISLRSNMFVVWIISAQFAKRSRSNFGSSQSLSSAIQPTQILSFESEIKGCNLLSQSRSTLVLRRPWASDSTACKESRRR